MRLEPGQVAVVTGGASGIGRGIVDALAARGLTVVLVDVEERQLGAAVAELRERGVTAEGARVDVRDAAAMLALADRVLAEHGRVDVLCNNAGVIAARRPVWEHTADDWRWTVDVNLIGVANGIAAFVPSMVAAGAGHVVNTSSMAGLCPLDGGGNAAYSASKHGVIGLSETLRADLDEVAPAVGVTVLCPGPVPSQIHDSARNRPAELADVGPIAPPAKTTSMTVLEPVPAEVVGGQVVAAVESNRMYLLTDEAIAPLARARIDRVLADL
ncbi:SDR family NAD(P)-dependent oxidoreductase [Nocardioides nitrophenolicus]|uniref:SDR family NAD(P)-dependent oxidoreductase n=1 Tax=Nocardioides nitrophenolicus TaxID=60489 RepID=UPI00195E56A4|nr:SDR family NAD(P)-dependent oxidoreductase [Nocardioides nitrophenolicus]MBM7516455.1 NAD(P)-dependent dehydrogenase (short-subunit alcohol dehydrogenase family) [Nocardioides nitrophenolicus]